MPNTPEQWLDALVVNATTAGTQNAPQVTQLTDGRILVAWVSNDDTGVGSPNGTDIIGQLFDEFGVPIGSEFRLNTAGQIDDEGDFALAATPAGGWIVVYEDVAIATSLRMEVYDSTGTRIDFESVANDVSTAFNNYADPEIVISGNTAIISYTRIDGASSEDVYSRRYDLTAETLGAETAVMTGDVTNDSDMAVLTNGNIVTVAARTGTGEGLSYRVQQADGTPVTSSTFVASTFTDSDDDHNPSVAALSGGGFVIAWENTDTVDDDVLFQVFDAAGIATSSVLSFDPTGNFTNNQASPRIVGLADGSFVILVDDNESGEFDLKMRHYDASGAQLGSEISISNGNELQPDITLTQDGRIFVVYQNGLPNSGDIVMEIWDTRDNATQNDADDWIGTIGDDVLTAGQEGGSDGDIFLWDGDDTLSVTTAPGFGVETFDGGDGNDSLTFDGIAAVFVDATTGEIRYDAAGGAADDFFANFETITGGTGDDTLISSGDGTYNGGDGDDTIVAGLTAVSEILDGGAGTDTLDVTSWDGTYTINMVTGVTNFGGESFINFENIILGNGTNNVTGTGGDNIMTGGTGADTFDGSSGSDTLNGGDGDDVLTGGGGLDTLNGGNGDDVLTGGTGNDTINGGAGDDRFVFDLGWGMDILDGDADSDTVDFSLVFGFDLRLDVLNGYTSADGSFVNQAWQNMENIIGSQGNDHIIGDGAINRLEGGLGLDDLFGGAGDDQLFGDDGNDDLYGGLGADVLDGGAGHDRAFYSQAAAGLRADLFNSATNTGEAAGDSYSSIEALYGSIHNDILSADHSGVDLVGLAGNDQLIGRNGRDRLFGGDGNDRLDGGRGNDDLHGNAGIDTFVIRVGAGKDRIFTYEQGIDIIEFGGGPGSFSDLSITINASGDTVITHFNGVTSLIGFTGTLTAADFVFLTPLPNPSGNNVTTNLTAGNDNVSFGIDNDTVNGLAGNDIIRGGIGDDILNGGDGNDQLFGGLGADHLDGGAGIDRASYTTASSGVTVNLINPALNTGEAAGDTYSSIENIFGTIYDDILIGDAGDNDLQGLGDDDQLIGADGDDRLFGGDGDDRLTGGRGDDDLFGGAGSDTFVFGANSGTDRIFGFEDGLDIIQFQSGPTQFSDLTITFDGADSLITWTNRSIELIGFDATALTDADFLF